MATPAQTLRDRITFTINQPVEIQLDRDGNPTASTARDGSEEYRYFLAQHRIMWVPAEVHAAIQRADGGDSACFALTKHRAPKPWTVIQLEADEPQQPAARPAPAPAPQPPTPAARRAPDMPAQRHINEPESDNGPLYTALCAAIRTAAAAERFGASIGRPVAFETGDIRAMAATLFIHQTGGGPR